MQRSWQGRSGLVQMPRHRWTQEQGGSANSPIPVLMQTPNGKFACQYSYRQEGEGKNLECDYSHNDSSSKEHEGNYEPDNTPH
jgi:hypothetical protein